MLKIDTRLWYLGGYIGPAKYAKEYMSYKVSNWVNSIESFSQIT